MNPVQNNHSPFEDFLSPLERTLARLVPLATPEKMFIEKITALANNMVHRHGTEMFLISRNYSRVREKVSWLCRLSKEQMQALSPASDGATVQANFTPGIAGLERVEILQKLADMNTECEFMLVIEIPSNTMTHCLARVYTANDLPPASPYYGFLAYELEPIPETWLRAPKWICMGCLTVEKNKKLMICGGCKYTRYCSPDCQHQHWSFHKERCPLLARIKTS